MKTHRPSHHGHSQPANPFEANASALGKSFRTLQGESVRFMSQRFEENMRAVERLGACRSLPEIFAEQQKWFADTARAYSEEWTKYSQLMADALQARSNGAAEEREDAPRTH